MSKLNIEDWHCIDYLEAWDRQKYLFELLIQQKSDGLENVNHWIYCEHPHVITMGRFGNQKNLLFSTEQLKTKGIAFYQTDRGGDITYHGQGQLVGYPILDLDSLGIGLKQYIWLLEEIIIRTLHDFQITATRLTGATGVWLDIDKESRTRKICAIGVKSSRFVTMHGFALNVNTDLAYFSYINPCGFIDKGVTTMAKEKGYEIPFNKIIEIMNIHVADLILSQKNVEFTK